jgi:hypothetical protein
MENCRKQKKQLKLKNVQQAESMDEKISNARGSIIHQTKRKTKYNRKKTIEGKVTLHHTKAAIKETNANYECRKGRTKCMKCKE